MTAAVSGTGEPGDKVVVLYIFGSGRSGSTLVERILGTFPGYTNVGELVGLFRQTLVHDERCGCGSRFSECPFWQGVGRVFDNWDPAFVHSAARLQRSVVRQRRSGSLLVPRLATGEHRADQQRWVALQEQLYRAIADQAGARVVVDASKYFAPALLTRQCRGIDLRFLYLVRDVRGVAYSWAKSGVKRPHAAERDDVMGSFSVARTAARWSRAEAQAALLKFATRYSATVRYEDLVTSPASTVQTALRDLGLPESEAADHLVGQTVTLPPSHGLGGNPGRFTTGPIELRADKAYRAELSDRDWRMITAIGLPGLIRHGYQLRRSDTSTRVPR